MINHSISMILLPGNIIQVSDTTAYSIGEPASKFGRAYFIKLNDALIDASVLSPMISSVLHQYTSEGRYECLVYFFPFWDDAKTYAEGDIVLYDAISGTTPGNPIDGPATTYPRLFVANSGYVALDKPMSSSGWDYLDDDTAVALTQCQTSVDAGEGVLVSANLYTQDIVVPIMKIEDYVYQVEILMGGERVIEYHTLESYVNDGDPLKTETVTGVTQFDTRVLLGDDPIDIIIVKVIAGDEVRLGIVYEISKLVNNINGLIKMLYCIDSMESDCQGVTLKEEQKARKDMTVLVTLWLSVIFKINHSYSKSIYIGSLSDNVLTLLSEAQKELNRIQVTLNNIDYVTID